MKAKPFSSEHPLLQLPPGALIEACILQCDRDGPGELIEVLKDLFVYLGKHIPIGDREHAEKNIPLEERHSYHCGEPRKARIVYLAVKGWILFDNHTFFLPQHLSCKSGVARPGLPLHGLQKSSPQNKPEDIFFSIQERDPSMFRTRELRGLLQNTSEQFFRIRLFHEHKERGVKQLKTFVLTSDPPFGLLQFGHVDIQTGNTNNVSLRVPNRKRLRNCAALRIAGTRDINLLLGGIYCS